MILLNEITFAYDRDDVIHDLSLEISAGSFTGIIGPNGAGKTTLLKLISGTLTPQFGTITINGRAITSYSRCEIAKMIAVVPQIEAPVFPFSAFEIVLMGRAPYLKRFGFETKRDLEIAENVMRKTGTWGLRERSIDELSGGERQRVLIARALAEEPRILLMDEPTTFLDIRHQLEIMEILSSLNKSEGMTIVSAMHDINLAIAYCDDIALLYNGGIFSHGKPEDVITYVNLKRIFGADVYVGVNEFTGKPYYIPM